MRRLLFVTAGLVFAVGIACNTSDFTPAQPKDCTKVECTCEEDPSQPTCKGFSGQPEGGLDANTQDATPTLDANVDSGSDASSDAAEDADAADQ
jgi:hypothetical protein